jgi:hypothetical protein
MTVQSAPNTFTDGTALAEGKHYCFQIGSETEWPGVVFAEPGVMRWRYTTDPKRSPWSSANLFGKPEFVVTDTDGNESLRVRRASRFPPRFEITEQGRVVGRISLQSILRDRYILQFGEEPAWTFHMPLFTVSFRAVSTSGREVLVRVGPSKKQWNILAEPGTDSCRLLCSLAFIHREWWSYS